MYCLLCRKNLMECDCSNLEERLLELDKDRGTSFLSGQVRVDRAINQALKKVPQKPVRAKKSKK
jgi:hypothetical protein